MQARHEYKHSLNHMDYIVLRGRLSAVLPRDSNAGPDGSYKIRSLYFDTPNDRALREKIDGVNRREKFRIRRYNDDDTFIRLEKKSKVNGLCYKQSAPVSAREVALLLEGELHWMAVDERPLVTELYGRMNGSRLQPKVIVEYARDAFVFPAGNVRVTLDRDIRTGLHAVDFLNNRLPAIAAGDQAALLEVKYDAFLPGFIADLLQIGDRRAAACSKYALARIYG